MLNDPFTCAIHANHVRDKYLANAVRYRQAQDLKKLGIDTEPTLLSRTKPIAWALQLVRHGSMRAVEAPASP